MIDKYTFVMQMQSQFIRDYYFVIVQNTCGSEPGWFLLVPSALFVRLKI